MEADGAFRRRRGLIRATVCFFVPLPDCAYGGSRGRQLVPQDNRPDKASTTGTVRRH